MTELQQAAKLYEQLAPDKKMMFMSFMQMFGQMLIALACMPNNSPTNANAPTDTQKENA